MTQPPKYAQKYKVKGNCLYEILPGKSGTIERKLCNLAPAVLREISMDDGVSSAKREAGCEPKFVLFLLGKTGSRKSTLAALTLSFFGRFTASELPLSFRDTSNSMEPCKNDVWQVW